MKRVVALALITSLLAFGVSADSQAGFTGGIDFSVNIRELSELAAKGDASAIPSDTFFILSGTVGAISITSEDDAPFTAIVELVAGAWTSPTELTIYRVYVNFEGEQYRDQFTKGSDTFLNFGTGVIVIAKFDSIGKDFLTDKNVMFLDAFAIRKIK